MNFLKSLLLFFLFFGLGNFKAQKPLENIPIRHNFNIKYYDLLEHNYTNKRKQILLNKNLRKELQSLKNDYNERVQKNIKDFYSSLLTENVVITSYLDNYPDINAVFLNRGNLLSEEKISDEEKQKYNELFLEISKQIPNDIYIELSKITDEINRDKFALTIPYRFEIFQDLFDENQRKRIDIINFLLWNAN